MQEIDNKLLKAIAMRKAIEKNIYPRWTDKGIVYGVQVGYMEDGNYKSKCATCKTLEDAREKREEFRKQYQVNLKHMTYEEKLERRIKKLQDKLNKLREQN